MVETNLSAKPRTRNRRIKTKLRRRTRGPIISKKRNMVRKQISMQIGGASATASTSFTHKDFVKKLDELHTDGGKKLGSYKRKIKGNFTTGTFNAVFHKEDIEQLKTLSGSIIENHKDTAKLFDDKLKIDIYSTEIDEFKRTSEAGESVPYSSKIAPMKSRILYYILNQSNITKNQILFFDDNSNNRLFARSMLGLDDIESVVPDYGNNKKETKEFWKEFWDESYIKYEEETKQAFLQQDQFIDRLKPNTEVKPNKGQELWINIKDINSETDKNNWNLSGGFRYHLFKHTINKYKIKNLIIFDFDNTLVRGHGPDEWPKDKIKTNALLEFLKLFKTGGEYKQKKLIILSGNNHIKIRKYLENLFKLYPYLKAYELYKNDLNKLIGAETITELTDNAKKKKH